MTFKSPFQKILVATDFSPHSEAALKQALWVAGQSGAKIVLAHVLPDLRSALLSAASSAQLDMLLGDGDTLQSEIREDSNGHLKALIARMDAGGLRIRCETLLGDPSVALIHAVQRDQYDLVMVGTRGQSVWEKFFVGSTAKRLIRKCPAPVWTVKAENLSPPKSVLAATDLSDVSLRAARVGREIARQAGAEFHLLHVIDSKDVPEGVIERLGPGSLARAEVNKQATQRLAEFVRTLDGDDTHINSHLSWGIPSQQVGRLADYLKTDLLVLGSVGRSGLKGVVLGNTAERVLDTCNCSVLTVKPVDFVSPIEPPSRKLEPDS